MKISSRSPRACNPPERFTDVRRFRGLLHLRNFRRSPTAAHAPEIKQQRGHGDAKLVPSVADVVPAFEFLTACPRQHGNGDQIGQQPPGGMHLACKVAPISLGLVVQIHRQRQNQQQHDLARVRPARPKQHQRRQHESQRRQNRQSRHAQRPMQVGSRAPQYHHADRHDQVGDDGGHRNDGRELAPAAEEKQKYERHDEVEPHCRPGNSILRMYATENLRHGATALHGVNHASGGRRVG